jgi:short subunit fatty acids transporter
MPCYHNFLLFFLSSFSILRDYFFYRSGEVSNTIADSILLMVGLDLFELSIIYDDIFRRSAGLLLYRFAMLVLTYDY